MASSTLTVCTSFHIYIYIFICCSSLYAYTYIHSLYIIYYILCAYVIKRVQIYIYIYILYSMYIYIYVCILSLSLHTCIYIVNIHMQTFILNPFCTYKHSWIPSPCHVSAWQTPAMEPQIGLAVSGRRRAYLGRSSRKFSVEYLRISAAPKT